MSRHLWGHRIERETRPLAPDAVREENRPLDQGRAGGDHDVNALRAEYQAKVGRKPSPEWSVDELRARISEV